jgi:RNA polymerase sigma factor (sigma-70 family)
VDSAELTSWSVILRAAAGEATDRETFSRRYGPVIRAYLAARWRRAQDHDVVADATSEVFIECFKRDGALSRVDRNRPGGFRAFLYGVVRNVALMAERRLARTRDHAGDGKTELDELAADDATLSQVFDRAFAETIVQEARVLMGARAQRSEAARRRFEVMALRFERGLPPREIATTTALPVERVYEMLKEARRDFRAALLEVLASYHPGSTEAELEQHGMQLLQSLR